jgi:hypothetical protein
MASRVGAPPFVVDKLSAQARRYTPAALARATDALTMADRNLKGLATGLPIKGRHPGDRDTSEKGVTSGQRVLGKPLSERIVLESLVTELVTLGR